MLLIDQIIPNPLGLNAMYGDGRVGRIGQTGPFEPGYVCLQPRDCRPTRSGTVLWTVGCRRDARSARDRTTCT